MWGTLPNVPLELHSTSNTDMQTHVVLSVTTIDMEDHNLRCQDLSSVGHHPDIREEVEDQPEVDSQCQVEVIQDTQDRVDSISNVTLDSIKIRICMMLLLPRQVKQI